jgi:hypothetical protein
MICLIFWTIGELQLQNQELQSRIVNLNCSGSCFFFWHFDLLLSFSLMWMKIDSMVLLRRYLESLKNYFQLWGLYNWHLAVKTNLNKTSVFIQNEKLPRILKVAIHCDSSILVHSVYSPIGKLFNCEIVDSRFYKRLCCCW